MHDRACMKSEHKGVPYRPTEVQKIAATKCRLPFPSFFEITKGTENLDFCVIASFSRFLQMIFKTFGQNTSLAGSGP